MRKEIFVPGEYYHIYNRTILNVPEFEDYENALKLSQAFLLANSTESTKAFDCLRDSSGVMWRKSIEAAWRGDKLVDVLAYAIMPDHYHILLKELREGGISNFVRKCNTSIAKYINIKKGRKGALFDGPFCAKHIDSNRYLLHLSLYIHLNPLDFIDNKNWRKGNLKNWQLKRKELLKYPWTSLKGFLFGDYEDLILSGTEIISSQFKSRKEYEVFLQDWSQADLESVDKII